MTSVILTEKGIWEKNLTYNYEFAAFYEKAWFKASFPLC